MKIEINTVCMKYRGLDCHKVEEVLWTILNYFLNSTHMTVIRGTSLSRNKRKLIETSLDDVVIPKQRPLDFIVCEQ